MGARVPRGPPPVTPKPVTPPRPPPPPQSSDEDVRGLIWLQKALSGASETDDVKPEDVSKHTSPLPVLDPTRGLAPCVAGDWLTQSHYPLQRTQVWERAHELYRRWLAAGPQERLTRKATEEGEPSRYDSIKYGRVEQAAISLLPNVLPVWLQTELISNRQLGSTAIIFRVLTAFQPGGLTEKSAILDALTRPAPGKAFSDTADVQELFWMWRK